MATCSSILAWEIPWTEEPGGLQSMEPQKSQTGLKRLSTPVAGGGPLPGPETGLLSNTRK